MLNVIFDFIRGDKKMGFEPKLTPAQRVVATAIGGVLNLMRWTFTTALGLSAVALAVGLGVLWYLEMI